jgi:hypothetical protein
VRARTEYALLLAATFAAAAFVVSFALGLRATTGPATSAEAIAARDFLNRGRPPRVEVLNGAGRTGLARDATDRLRTAGFDVVFIGNASAPTDTSYVLDRAGRADVARAIANALTIQRISARVDSTLYVEATVVLGKDWMPGAGGQ